MVFWHPLINKRLRMLVSFSELLTANWETTCITYQLKNRYSRIYVLVACQTIFILKESHQPKICTVKKDLQVKHQSDLLNQITIIFLVLNLKNNRSILRFYHFLFQTLYIHTTTFTLIFLIYFNLDFIFIFKYSGVIRSATMGFLSLAACLAPFLLFHTVRFSCKILSKYYLKHFYLQLLFDWTVIYINSYDGLRALALRAILPVCYVTRHRRRLATHICAYTCFRSHQEYFY